MPGIRSDIELFRATDNLLTFTKVNAPLDITGWTMKFRIKKRFSETSPLVGPVDATIIDAINGVCTVALLVTDLDGLVKAGPNPDEPLEYWYDLQRDDAGFQNVLAYGKVYISPQTRTP